jgi:hypothetical protein
MVWSTLAGTQREAAGEPRTQGVEPEIVARMDKSALLGTGENESQVQRDRRPGLLNLWLACPHTR